MLTIKLYEELNRILIALDNAEYLNTSIEQINELHSGYIKNIQIVTTNPNNRSQELVQFLINAQLKIRTIKPRKIFKDIDNIQEILRDIKIDDPITKININQTLHHLEMFADAFELFVENKTPLASINLIDKSKLLRTYLDGLIQGIKLFTNNYIVTTKNMNDVQALSILLSSKMTLSTFIIKLQSLEIIYEELCILLNISLIEHPIQISKIESGSLWVKIFGNTKVIDFLTKTLNSGAKFIYTNYTSEGKRSMIPTDVKTIESILHLKENLEKQGISTKELNEELKKSSILIAKRLNKLLENESNITINNKSIAIDNHINKHIEHQVSPAIEYKKEDKDS